MNRIYKDEYYEQFQIHYGAVVTQLRMKQKKNREMLAREAKVSVATIAIIERGKGNPMLETMDNIAKALGTSVGRMFELADKRSER